MKDFTSPLSATENRTQRNEVLDAVAGLLILHMILGHIMAWSYLKKTDLYAWMDVLFFFMPWFFFKSGQFHRDGHYLRQLLSSARRLLIPYVVFSLAGYAVKCYTLSLHNDFSVHLTRVWTKFSHEGVLPGNGPLWFLLVLFVARQVYSLCPRQARVPLLAVAILGAFALQHFFSVTDPIYPASLCTGLFFYGLGHQLRDVPRTPSFVLTAFLLYAGICLVQLSTLDMRTNLLYRGHFMLWVLAAAGGILSINALFAALPGWLLLPLRWVGRNSMSFYVTHMIWITAAKFVLMKRLGCTDHVHLAWGLVAVCVVVLPLQALLFRLPVLHLLMGEKVRRRRQCPKPVPAQEPPTAEPPAASRPESPGCSS